MHLLVRSAPLSLETQLCDVWRLCPFLTCAPWFTREPGPVPRQLCSGDPPFPGFCHSDEVGAAPVQPMKRAEDDSEIWQEKGLKCLFVFNFL